MPVVQEFTTELPAADFIKNTEAVKAFEGLISKSVGVEVEKVIVTGAKDKDDTATERTRLRKLIGVGIFIDYTIAVEILDEDPATIQRAISVVEEAMDKPEFTESLAVGMAEVPNLPPVKVIKPPPPDRTLVTIVIIRTPWPTFAPTLMPTLYDSREEVVKFSASGAAVLIIAIFVFAYYKFIKMEEKKAYEKKQAERAKKLIKPCTGSEMRKMKSTKGLSAAGDFAKKFLPLLEDLKALKKKRKLSAEREVSTTDDDKSEKLFINVSTDEESGGVWTDVRTTSAAGLQAPPPAIEPVSTGWLPRVSLFSRHVKGQEEETKEGSSKAQKSVGIVSTPALRTFVEEDYYSSSKISVNIKDPMQASSCTPTDMHAAGAGSGMDSVYSMKSDKISEENPMESSLPRVKLSISAKRGMPSIKDRTHETEKPSAASTAAVSRFRSEIEGIRALQPDTDADQGSSHLSKLGLVGVAKRSIHPKLTSPNKPATPRSTSQSTPKELSSPTPSVTGRDSTLTQNQREATRLRLRETAIPASKQSDHIFHNIDTVMKARVPRRAKHTEGGTPSPAPKENIREMRISSQVRVVPPLPHASIPAEVSSPVDSEPVRVRIRPVAKSPVPATQEMVTPPRSLFTRPSSSKNPALSASASTSPTRREKTARTLKSLVHKVVETEVKQQPVTPSDHLFHNIEAVMRTRAPRRVKLNIDDKSTPSRLPASASGITDALNTASANFTKPLEGITSNNNDPPKIPAAATDIGSPVDSEPVRVRVRPVAASPLPVVRSTSPIPAQAPFARPSATIKKAAEVSAPAPDAEQVKVRVRPAAASRSSGDHIFHTIEAVVKARSKKLRQIDDSTNIKTNTSSTSTLDMASVTSVQAGAKQLKESAPSNVSVSVTQKPVTPARVRVNISEEASRSVSEVVAPKVETPPVRIRVHNRGAFSPTPSVSRDGIVAIPEAKPEPEPKEIKVIVIPQSAAQAGEHLFHNIESVMKMRPKRLRAAPKPDGTASDPTVGLTDSSVTPTTTSDETTTSSASVSSTNIS